jgi:hypothetical protein
MKINWITKETQWAFRHLCEHLAKAMPEHNHVFDGSKGDVKYVCSPSFFKQEKADSKTILHVDSNRWYEKCIKQ